MFSCPTGTYKCNTDNSGSCKISLSDSMYTCGPNDFVVNSNTLGLNLSGAYCYAQPSSPNNFIACVPSLDKKTTSPDCKSGYTRCDSGGTNTCTVGKQYNASQLCSDNVGNAYSIKDIAGTEIVGALCHIDSNTACRPVSEDCGTTCKPNETCISELTDVCKAAPPPPITCNPLCENNAQCIKDPKNPGNAMCDCTTASLATQITDCFGRVSGSPYRPMQPIFNGPTCKASLPDGFVIQTFNQTLKDSNVTSCNANTNGLECADGIEYNATDFFYQCQTKDGNCPTDNLSVGLNKGLVCGKNYTDFKYTNLQAPDSQICDIGVCDASTIPKATCDPLCSDPLRQICVVDPNSGSNVPICFTG